MKSRKLLCVQLAFALSLLPGVAQAETWYIAKASWHFEPLGSDLEYEGIGKTKEDALAAAQNTCIHSQTIEDQKYFCYNEPRSVSYTEKEDCGQHWTGWINIGGAVGSPCPGECSRGPEVGQAYRTVDLFKIQTKHKFQCWKP